MVDEITIPIANPNSGGYWVNGIHYAGYPKVTKLKPNNAIAADVVTQLVGTGFSYEAQVGSVGHLRQGVNVCYADTSVQFVPFKQFSTNYSSGSNACIIYSWDSKSGVWNDYDVYRK